MTLSHQQTEAKAIIHRAAREGRALTPRELAVAESLLASSSQSAPGDSAARKLPTFIAELAAGAEVRQEMRRELIANIDRDSEKFARTDADLVAQVQPLDQTIAKHEAALAKLRSERDALVQARQSAAFVFKNGQHAMHKLLRADAELEVDKFHRKIEEIRTEISSNPRGRREAMLGFFEIDRPLNVRVRLAMDRTLASYNAADVVAITEIDVTAGLAQLWADLIAARFEI